MLKRIAAVLATLVTVVVLAGCGGCGGPSAETANREAKAFCADHGGVDHINYKPYRDFLDPAYYNAECVDGSEIE